VKQLDALHLVSKKTVQTFFLSELCQISTDCENFWHKDSDENELFCCLLESAYTTTLLADSGIND